MQPGKPDPSLDRPYRENGEERPRKIGLVVEKQSGRAVRFGGCTIEDLAFLAQQLPGAYQQLMANEASRRRLEWADLIAQITGHICGLAALLILAAVSWHAIDRGASTQGASIICTGAVSIVALFVTGRTTSRKYSKSPLPEPGGDKQTSRDRR
jgi:hypothetical protein